MAEIINAKEAETLKTVVGSLVKRVEELTEKADEVVTAQRKADTSLQEMATARRTGTPVQFMKADNVKTEIRNCIRDASNNKIDRQPLIKIYGHNGIWIGLAIAIIGLLLGIWMFVVAHKKSRLVLEQDYYWAHRAYLAAEKLELENPGRVYKLALSDFQSSPEQVKNKIQRMENDAMEYQERKTLLWSFLGSGGIKDIRLLSWENNDSEWWFLYRYYDEETERSVHIWKDGKVEETTNKIVSDLASAQKYSKRKIWTVIREAQVITKNEGDAVP